MYMHCLNFEPIPVFLIVSFSSSSLLIEFENIKWAIVNPLVRVKQNIAPYNSLYLCIQGP
jgi:hypothetical protein